MTKTDYFAGPFGIFDVEAPCPSTMFPTKRLRRWRVRLETEEAIDFDDLDSV
jgi:hypothetical protein